MKKEKAAIPMVGASSLLVIFSVLCLTVFALLALNTATSSTKLSQSSAEGTAAYYKADSEANKILAMLRLGDVPPNVHADGNVYSYSCEISESQMLDVTVKINSQSDYTVLKWQRVSINEWKANDTIDVWDGIF